MSVKSIGPYRIVSEIAAGGMGVVYRALDPALNREVALKFVLNPDASATERKRFAREGRALAKLTHRSIVSVLAVGEHEERPYLVMDLVEGESLEDRLGRDGPLPPETAIEIARKLAVALQHCHERSVLHRDVKPANVILTPSGEPVLTDFGLAKDLAASLRSSVSTHGRFMGTPGYWPPEQALGDLDSIGTHSDIYSLGATLYAMLTGRPPVTGTSLIEILAATTSAEPEPPSHVRSELGVDVDAICLRCLAKAPADRYPSASALAVDLERLQTGGSRQQEGFEGAGEGQAKTVLQWVLVGALAVAVLITGLLGWRLVATQRDVSQARGDLERHQAKSTASDREALALKTKLAAAEQTIAVSKREQAKQNARLTAAYAKRAAAADADKAKHEEMDAALAKERLERHQLDVLRGQVGWSPPTEDAVERAQSYLAEAVRLEETAPEAALLACSKALRFHPRSSEAFFWRGMLLCRAGALPSGTLDLSRALELAPRAFADLRRSSQRSGDEWVVLFTTFFGLYTFDTGVVSVTHVLDLNRVKAAVDKIVKSYPGAAHAQFLRANSMLVKAEFKTLSRTSLLAARSGFDECLRLNPNHGTALLHRGHTQALLARLSPKQEREDLFASALRDLRLAAQRAPEVLRVSHYLLARIEADRSGEEGLDPDETKVRLDAAIRELTAAVDAGWVGFDRINAERAFDALRELPAFRKLLPAK